MSVTLTTKTTNQTTHQATLLADEIRLALGRVVLDSLGPVPPDGAVTVDVAYTFNQVQGSDAISVASAAVTVVVDHQDPATPPKVTQVFRRQAKQALILNDLDDKVDAAIAAIADPKQQKLMRAWYDDALVFERDSPELASMATTLGLTSDQLDALFAQAATL
jgi:hypothetical protein